MRIPLDVYLKSLDDGELRLRLLTHQSRAEQWEKDIEERRQWVAEFRGEIAQMQAEIDRRAYGVAVGDVLTPDADAREQLDLMHIAANWFTVVKFVGDDAVVAIGGWTTRVSVERARAMRQTYLSKQEQTHE